MGTFSAHPPILQVAVTVHTGSESPDDRSVPWQQAQLKTLATSLSKVSILFLKHVWWIILVGALNK